MNGKFGNFKIVPQRLAIALLALGLSSISTVQAYGVASAPQAEQGGNADHLPPRFAALGLSDAQKDKIKTMHESRHAEHKAKHQAARALHESLYNLSPGAANYTQEVDRIATQMGQAHANEIRENAAFRAQEWAVLTPTQQSQLAAMPKPEFDKMHDRHEH